jgi:AcrR family transcriptional regulator
MIARRRAAVKSASRARRATSAAAGHPAAARSRGRRTASEAGRTRQRLLAQAVRLFARKGYNGTSLRELAKAGGVRLFTIQHHFGSKQRLYEEILRRWDTEVQELMSRVLERGGEPRQIVERVVDALFDLFVANRGRVTLNARAVLGEGLPRRLADGDQGWVRFMSTSMTRHRLGAGGLDPGLLLITVEGILHNHVLGTRHYRHLFGRDLTDPRVAARVKRHLQQVILALLDGDGLSS